MKPRWYQEEAVEAVMNSLDMNPDVNPLIAAPTGSGKSVIIDGLVDGYLSEMPEFDVLLLSHTKEIVTQDYNVLVNSFGEKLVGIYSAGLRRREVRKITVAGIGSVYKKAALFSNVGLIIVDEAHLINHNDSGMYRRFISDMDVPVVGLTATHYRTGGGYLHEHKDSVFNELAYDLTEPDKFKRLQDEGFLSKVYMKGTDLKLDATDVKITGGDYNQKQLADKFDRNPVTEAAVDEIVDTGANYKHWLVFAIDIQHAEHIANVFREKHGRRTACIHSKMTEDRDEVIKRVKEGYYQAIVNVDVLTTGFDFPAIDMICLLRPTKSPVVYVQSVGRGLRVADGKDHCLILDFGNVVSSLGPIDSVTVKSQKAGKGSGDPIMKECPECQGMVYAATRECPYCGHEYQFKHGLSANSQSGSVTSNGEPSKGTWVDVRSIEFGIWQKQGKPDSVVVTYHVGRNRVKEWVCPAHGGRATNMAKHWMKIRNIKYAVTARQLLKNIHECKSCRMPTKILVKNEGKFHKVDGCRFD